MALHPSRAYAALGARYAGALQVMNTSSGEVALAQVPFPFEPNYGVTEGPRGPAFVNLDATRLGYVDVAATNAAIYTLYSGKSRETHGNKASLGEFLHVFDWNGVLLSAHQLDAPAVSITVDPSGHQLFALRHEPLPAVLRYELKAAR